MLELMFFLSVLLINLVLIAVAANISAVKGRRLDMARALFAALLPVFGPVVVIMLASADDRSPPDGEWLRRNEEKYQSLMAVSMQAAQTVPLEEALLINDNRHRRLLMLNMLRSDPRKYMDVLLVARFNDDQETAHYATATLLEIQRQMQLETQKLQIAVTRAPEDNEAREKYVRSLSEYCESGLLEAQLLRRQRQILAEALADALPRLNKSEYYSMAVRNYLSLGEPSGARACAQSMLDAWPRDERAWLEMMRVYAETRDQAGMAQLLMNARFADVEWTGAGYETLKFWMGKAE